MRRAAVITSSDSGSRGERDDISGQVICEILEREGYQLVYRNLLPDERELLAAEMARIADEDIADLILTTGGTGFSPRDFTPEATQDVCQRMVPGIPEAMRACSMQVTKRGMLSRQAAGIRNRTLIVNLPGSPKAVRECLEYVIGALGHGIDILRGDAGNCGSSH